MRSALIIVATVTVGLSSCASADMPNIPGLSSRSSSTTPPLESFSYAPAADERLRVQVSSVTTYRDPGFIPSDPNWLQIDLSVTNAGSRTVSLIRVQERLTDGTTLNAAQSVAELNKAPNMMREGMITTALSAGGMAVGAMLFPPAAIISGAIIAFRPMFMGDRAGRMAEQLNRRSLRTGPIAPDTTTSGLIFVPAVAGQTGLIVFYSEGGEEHALTIARN